MAEKYYTIKQLAQLAGVSTRTLRYYDQIGLLPPAALGQNGYRQYGAVQLKRLQQIRFYCELGIPRGEIRRLLDATPLQQQLSLETQLAAVQAEQARLEALKQNLQKTILELKGEYTMTETERFEGMKRQTIAENEKTYGSELREKYGDAAIEESNTYMQNMSREDWQKMQELERRIAEQLKTAAPNSAPQGEQGQKLAALHRQWLCLSWPQGSCTPAAHLAMAQMYRADARFAAYYNAITPNGAEYLCKAIEEYCKG